MARSPQLDKAPPKFRGSVSLPLRSCTWLSGRHGVPDIWSLSCPPVTCIQVDVHLEGQSGQVSQEWSSIPGVHMYPRPRSGAHPVGSPTL